MNSGFTLLCASALLLTVSACDKKEKPASGQGDDTSAALQLAQQQKQAEEEAEAERLAAEAAAKKEAEEKAAAALAADQLKLCCDSLAKTGFEDRSMALMKGVTVCESAHAGGKQLAETVSLIKEAIKDEAMPEACTPK